MPVIEINGSFNSSRLTNLIYELYGDCPIQEGITISIKGDEKLVAGFLDYASAYDVKRVGFEYVKFVVDEISGHIINSDNYQELLEDILTEYL